MTDSDKKDSFRTSDVIPGPVKEFSMSKFQAFGVRVSEFSDIRKAYQKIKEANYSAAHIVCGYHLYGPQMHIKQDYSDDMDHGMGKRVLNILKKKGVFNIAVFIVRHYDGQHIGPKRFEIVESLTSKMLSAMPGTLEYGQTLPDKTLFNALQKVAQKRFSKKSNTKCKSANVTPPPSSQNSIDTEGHQSMEQEADRNTPTGNESQEQD